MELNNSKSITSEKHTKDANNYIGNMMDRIIGNYSNIMQSDKASGEDNDEENWEETTGGAARSSTNRADMIDHNASVEKRIEEMSEYSESSNNNIDINKDDKENSIMNNSGSSTVRNVAKDYVTGLMKEYY